MTSPRLSSATPRVRFGSDALVADPGCLAALIGRRVHRCGLVTNDAARLAADVAVRSRVALRDAGVPLVRLFSPEHGLAAAAPDGAAVADGRDALTGLPVLSLYGERLRPPREALADLDAVLFDVPDVGARFYTYTWTLWHLLAACADAGVPLVVLDRPNPLGGDVARAEGPLVTTRDRSFLGEAAIPIVHGCTLSELATLWRAEEHPGAALAVMPATGWTRDRGWPDLGLPWVPTSPAMPSFESARHYPGTCPFEATNLSVGRGTDAPFVQVGAPWLDADAVLADLASRAGVAGEACHFTPTVDRFAGEACAGVRLPADGASVPGPVARGLLLLASVMTTHRGRATWQAYPTAANPSGCGHLARLLGDSTVAAAFDAPAQIGREQVARWTRVDGWAERLTRAEALLYC